MPSLGKSVTIKLENGQLLMSDDQVEWAPLMALSENRFFLEEEEFRLVFVKDAAGNVTGFNLELEGVSIPAEKID
jgi:hypothetical protein